MVVEDVVEDGAAVGVEWRLVRFAVGTAVGVQLELGFMALCFLFPSRVRCSG